MSEKEIIVQQGKRQIPKSKRIIGDEKYTDILYGYLQALSDPYVEVDPITDKKIVKYRYIPKNKIKYTNISKSINISRQTASKRFSALIQLGLIEEKSDVYVLSEINKTEALLIPQFTLLVFDKTFKERSLSVYTYFFNRFFANDFKPFIFRMDQIKDYLGMSSTNKGTNDTITIIMSTLAQAHLIEYKLSNVPLEGKRENNLGDIKTIYKILEVNAVIGLDDQDHQILVPIKDLPRDKSDKN